MSALRAPAWRRPADPAKLPGASRSRLGALFVVVSLAAACGSTTPSAAIVTPTPAVTTPGPSTANVSPSVTPSPTVAATSNPTASVAAASPSASAGPVLPPDIARINGVKTDPARAARLPLAVMIDDNVQARPQAGFNAASVVYQAPADGGEDRYMLVFQEGDADMVGPVRSGRPYFVRWASEFRSAFAHFGGDAKTLQQVIPSMDGSLIYDVDALNKGGGAFHR